MGMIRYNDKNYTAGEAERKANSYVLEALEKHKGDFENPHKVTAEQAGAYTKAEADKKLSAHIERTDNPHKVTAEQVGAYTKTEADKKLSAHTNRTDNPHEVTKAQVGLSNADNTSDINKPISTKQQEALDKKANKATTLSGYGIEDAYTKSETYSKAETDKLLENKEDFVIKAEIKTASDSDGNISYSVICSTTKEEIMKAFNDQKNICLDATDKKSFNGIRKLAYVGYRMGGYAVFCGTFNDGKTVVVGLDENGWYINVTETYTKSEIDNLILGSWEALV